MRKILIFLVLCGVARATVRTAATCASADYNTQITAAAEGDTVQAPAAGGTATWTTSIVFSKNIILDGKNAGTGNGCTITINGGIIDATATSTASTTLEIRNFTLNGSTNGKITVRHTISTNPWLIHDNVFNGADAAITSNGVGEGVIYHNSLTDAAALAEEITINGCTGPTDMACRKDDITPGGTKFVFIEGNTLTGTTASNYAFFQTYYGGRFVARFNDFVNFGVETHGSSPGTCVGENGARWEEIYNNHHTHPNGNTVPIKIRGGSGLIFNNDSTVSGQSTILTDDCSSGTWPIQGMLSQGIEPAASTSTSTSDATKWNPMYVWNNSGFTSTNSGNALIQIGASEFACTHTSNKCDAVSTTPAKTFPTTLERCESAADVTAGCPVVYSYTPYLCPNPSTGLSGTCNFSIIGRSGYAVAGNTTYIVNNSNAPGGTGPSCTDTAGHGTLASPFCTLDFALTQMISGDTVQMRTGTYAMGSGFLLVQGPSGTSGAHTKIQNFPGDTPHITGVTSGSGFRLQNMSFLDISGLEISGPEACTSTEGGNNITWTNMNIHDCQTACNYVRKCTSAFCTGDVPSFVTWQSSTVNNCGLDTTQNGDGFYIGTSGDATDTTNHVTIQNNTITNTQTECVNVKDFTNNTVINNNTCDHNSLGNNGFVDSAIMLKSSTTTNTANDFVTNNIISNTGPGSNCGGTPSCGAVNSALRIQHQATIFNNIIYGPNLQTLGFCFWSDNSDTRLVYQNTCDANGGGNTRFLNIENGASPTLTNNIGSGATNNAAFNSTWFPNLASHDYHLNTDHNSTVNVNSVAPTDKDGTTRSATPDFGAFEFVPFSISGALGANGAAATINYTGAVTGSVTADGSGNYVINNLGNGSYTITPSKSGTVFLPTSQTVTISNGNLTGINFTETYTISGALGLNGAAGTVTYGGTASGSVTADGSGNYSISGLLVGTYSITPTKTGFSFIPASQVVTISNANVPNINFAISPSSAVVDVNGKVTLRGVQINGTPAANSGPVTLPQIWINSLEYASALNTPDFTITYPNSGTGGTWTCTGLGSFGPYTAWTQSSLQQAVNDAESCRASQNKSVKIIIPHNAGTPTNIFTGSAGIALPQSAPGGVSDTSTKFIVLTSDTPLPTSLQSGTVNTSGSTVTRTAGTAFTTGTLWNNTPILINGIFYTIASVTNGNTLTTTTSIGTNTGVAYSWGERTVCSQGVQDNLAVSPEPGIRNIGCNGTNMSYSLGITPTPVSGAFTLANGRATNTSNYNDVVSMYTIESNNNALSTAVADVNGVGPHHFAILNGEFRPVAGATLAQAPIGIGQDTETAESQLPNHIHFGYNYIHGDWQDAPVSGGVATGPAQGFNSLPNQMKIDCIYCSISYSYTDQSLRPGAEGHGFSFLLSKQFKIVHNWVEGQSINSLCGGFASPITINLFTVCYDMEDRGNRYTYPYSWVLAVEAGYDPNSVYTATGGHGTGATFHLLQTNGAPNAQGIIQMAIQAGGTGYAVNDVLTLTSIYDAGVSGGTVLVTAVGTSNAVASATIVSGTGYTVANGLSTTVNTGTGTGATVNITSVSPTGGITGITLANGGTGGTYTAANVLTVVQGGASGGTIGVNSVTSGVITSINVQAGTGYSLNGPVRKNNHEYKFSNRTVLDGNIFENGDFSGGQGQSISFKANQSSVVGGGDNYWTTQQNSTVTNNIWRTNCSGMSGGFRSNPNNGAGGGVSDTVAFYYIFNNLQYNISPLGPGCELSADFTIRNAADSAGTTWTANMTRTSNVATANLVPAQAHMVGMFHVGDPVLAYNCTDTSFNTNAEGFPQKTLGPLALPGTVTFGTTVTYGNNGPDVALGAGVTCTINNNQGTPNHFYANHNSDFALSTVAQDPSSSGLASNPCVLSFNFTFINTLSTWGGASAGPIGEGTRTTNCMFYPPQESYHHNAIPGRDTRVVCPGHAAGAGGINACYTEYNSGTVIFPPTTIWGNDTENCTTNNPQTESCLGILGNMSTGSFNYILGDWHQYRLCHVGDAACNNLASRYASGGTRQASDGLDMGADFTQFDPHQISIQYCASCGSFVDHQ